MSERPAAAVLTGRLPGLAKFADAEDRLSLLLYGKPGVGKTVFSGTAEDDERTSPVLYIDVEGGWLPISWRRRAIEKYEFRDFTKSANELAAGLREQTEFKCIIVDSLTVVGDRAMDSVLSAGRRSEEEAGDWNTWTKKMKRFIDMLRDAHAHLIVTALERDDDGFLSAALAGQRVRSELPGKFNTIARLAPATLVIQPTEEQKKRGDNEMKALEVRRMYLRATAKYDGKDRSDPTGKLPPYIDDSTVTKLLDRMAEGRRMAISLAEQNSRPQRAKGA